MSENEENLVEWLEFETSREQLGAHFARILQYFREDGTKSVDKIEWAMRQRNSSGLVDPAHTLKGEALQFGAKPLSELAEKIELAARHFVETQDTPEELVPDAAKLRPLFERTLALFENATNPIVERRSGTGDRRINDRRASNQTFGRL